MESSPRRRPRSPRGDRFSLSYLQVGLGGLLALQALGTVGFVLLEPNFGVFDAFYMTLITVSTVGYGEVHKLGLPGRILTSCIIVTGVFFVAIAVRGVIEAVVEGELAQFFGRRRLQRQISALEQHWIICGFGRIGARSVAELRASKRPPDIVVIEKDVERLRRCDEAGLFYVLGDATNEDVLLEAGIERAAGVLSLVRTDAENVYICLTARELNPNLRIVTRALDEHSEPRLRRAGADTVVSPYQVGGVHLARAVLSPALSHFLDVATGHDLPFEMDEVTIPPDSSLVGVRLAKSGIRSEHDVIVLAVRREGGKFLFNPRADTILAAGDVLLVAGLEEKLLALELWVRRSHGS